MIRDCRLFLSLVLVMVMLAAPSQAHPPSLEECVVMMKRELELSKDQHILDSEGFAHYQSCDTFLPYLEETTGKNVPESVCQSKADIDAWAQIQQIQFLENYSDDVAARIVSCLERAGWGKHWVGVFQRTRDCMIEPTQ